MPNINTFKEVVHEKKIFKGFCYNINIYKIMSPLGVTICDKNIPCHTPMLSGQWFMRRRFLKVFAI